MRRWIPLVLLPLPLLAGVNNDPSAARAAFVGAGVAHSIGVRAVLDNPGGLGFLKAWEFETAHLPWAFGTASEGMTYVMPFGRYGGAGVALRLFHGWFAGWNPLYHMGREVGRLDDHEVSGAVAWGYPFLKGRLSVGATLEFMDALYLSGGGLGLGIGGLYKTRLPGRGGDAEEDFRVGLAVRNLYHSDASQPVVVTAGAMLRPLPFLSLMLDLRRTAVRNYYSSFDVLTAAEAEWGRRFSKVFLRAGWSVLEGRAVLGGGAQVSVAGVSYRFDYAYDLWPGGSVAEDLGRTSWFSLVIARNPLLFRQIPPPLPPLPASAYGRGDRVMLTERRAAEGEGRVEPFRLALGKVSVSDSCLKSKNYDRHLAVFLPEVLGNFREAVTLSTQGDLLFEGVLAREGDLMQCQVTLKDGRTGKVLRRNVFEKSVTCAEESAARTLDLMLRREGDRIIILPRQLGEEEDRELGLLRAVAEEMGRWVAETGPEVLSAVCSVKANMPDIAIYADGMLVGRTGPDGRAEVKVRAGRRTLLFLKEGAGRQERTVTLAAGERQEVTVEVSEGVFEVPLEIVAAGLPLRVSLDGKPVGTTPVTIPKVRSGNHTLVYADSRGHAVREELGIDTEGPHRILALVRFEEPFQKVDAAVWHPLVSDAGVKVGARARRLEIKGTASDGEWTPSGLVSRPFAAGELTVEADVRCGKGTAAVVVLVDESGEAVGIGIDGRYGSVYEAGKGRRGLVPAVLFQGAEAERKVRMVWRKGTAVLEIDGMSLGERPHRMSGPVRLVLLADAAKAGEAVDFEVRNLVVRNEGR